MKRIMPPALFYSCIILMVLLTRLWPMATMKYGQAFQDYQAHARRWI